jgi:hypothetical protein
MDPSKLISFPSICHITISSSVLTLQSGCQVCEIFTFTVSLNITFMFSDQKSFISELGAIAKNKYNQQR